MMTVSAAGAGLRELIYSALASAYFDSGAVPSCISPGVANQVMTTPKANADRAVSRILPHALVETGVGALLTTTPHTHLL